MGGSGGGEQDNKNKVNLERSRRFTGLEQLGTDQVASLFPLYTQAIICHIKQQN